MKNSHIVILASAVICLSCSAKAEQVIYNTYGRSGMIDMPMATMPDDAEMATVFSTVGGINKATLTFQLSPRLSGSFRYTKIPKWIGDKATFDRSFDLSYQVLTEGKYRPAVSVGLVDFIGTGLFSGEYVVATKHLNPRFTVTGGLGWGRFASHGGFKNPLSAISNSFSDRPKLSVGLGGRVDGTGWFRGEAAFFGGMTWQANDRLRFSAEYSSDSYERQVSSGVIKYKTPINLGIDYAVANGADAKIYLLHGSTIGAAINLNFNPKQPAIIGGSEGAPIPVRVRAERSLSDLGWEVSDAQTLAVKAAISQIFALDNFKLRAVRFKDDRAIVLVENTKFLNTPEALGRVARVLSQATPDHIDHFDIVILENNLKVSKVSIDRLSLEQNEFSLDGAQALWATTSVADAYGLDLDADAPEKRFTWSINPYLEASIFDPDRPIIADVGIRATGQYDFGAGISLNGTIQQRVVGNLSSSDRVSNSVIAHVRSDSNSYKTDRGPTIPRLTLDYKFRPAQNVFGRISLGYLEQMYAGVSAEMLWKKVDSPFAIGVELNAVQKRAYTDPFALADYRTMTGHVSGYWALGHGYHAQVDIGRYLAKDWGATISFDREFANGWRVGAYATFTNVKFSDFGEGSFDKGLRFTIPVSFFSGKPSKQKLTTTLQSLTRDGGARLNVSGRLYEDVRELHVNQLEKKWARVLR